MLEQEETERQAETRERIFYRNTNEKLTMLLENYKVAMSTLQVPNKTEGVQNPSAYIADDLNMREVAVDEEEDENDGEDERDNLVMGPETIYYSKDDIDDLHKEWQATHQQEMIDLQSRMQAQLNVQASKSKAQENLGSMVQYPVAGMTPMGQLGLSMNAPAFVPG